MISREYFLAIFMPVAGLGVANFDLGLLSSSILAMSRNFDVEEEGNSVRSATVLLSVHFMTAIVSALLMVKWAERIGRSRMVMLLGSMYTLGSLGAM
jgi:hypothetical protein